MAHFPSFAQFGHCADVGGEVGGGVANLAESHGHTLRRGSLVERRMDRGTGAGLVCVCKKSIPCLKLFLSFKIKKTQKLAGADEGLKEQTAEKWPHFREKVRAGRRATTWRYGCSAERRSRVKLSSGGGEPRGGRGETGRGGWGP